MRNKILIILILLVLALGLWQWFYLRRAHSSFENYYNFRGCTELVAKTEDYGICKTKSGETIKIVKYQNKWYLDGDLPWACWRKLCVGF